MSDYKYNEEQRAGLEEGDEVIHEKTTTIKGGQFAGKTNHETIRCVVTGFHQTSDDVGQMGVYAALDAVGNEHKSYSVKPGHLDKVDEA